MSKRFEGFLLDDGVTAFTGCVVLDFVDVLFFEDLPGGNLIEVAKAIGFRVNTGEMVGGIVKKEFKDFYELLLVLLGLRDEIELFKHLVGVEFELCYFCLCHLEGKRDR